MNRKIISGKSIIKMIFLVLLSFLLYKYKVSTKLDNIFSNIWNFCVEYIYFFMENKIYIVFFLMVILVFVILIILHKFAKIAKEIYADLLPKLDKLAKIPNGVITEKEIINYYSQKYHFDRDVFVVTIMPNIKKLAQRNPNIKISIVNIGNVRKKAWEPVNANNK